MSKFIIYGLTDPRTGRVRYLGKSSNGLARPRSHAKRLAYEPGHKSRWIAFLHRLGLNYGVVVLEEAANDLDLKMLERYWICQGRGLGWQLTNHTDGGEGQSGAVFTAEHKAKLAASKRGKPRSAETKAACAAGMKAWWATQAVRKMPPFTAEHRANMSASRMGKYSAAQHAAAKVRGADPVARAKMKRSQIARRKRERASSKGPRLFVNLRQSLATV